MRLDPAQDSGAAPIFSRQLQAARGGSADTLGALMQASRAYLASVAQKRLRRSGRDPLEADDFLQESFLRGITAFGIFRGATESEWLGWLRQILVHLLADNGSERAPAPPALADVSAPPDVQTGIWWLKKGELTTLVQRALERVSAVQREILRWRFEEMQSWISIGQRPDISCEFSAS